MADAARGLCRDDDEFLALQKLWLRNEADQRGHTRNDFGVRLKQLRLEQSVSRRELADLFGVGGKKPARIVKYIEEDGFYSMQAYPAGLVAVLAGRSPEAARLLQSWQERRQVFHRRHRPEMRVDLRLARETYGFELKDVAPLLGYGPREYQKIEGGVEPLRYTARERILQAIHAASQKLVEELLALRLALQAAELASRAPPQQPHQFHHTTPHPPHTTPPPTTPHKTPTTPPPIHPTTYITYNTHSLTISHNNSTPPLSTISHNPKPNNNTTSFNSKP